MPNTAHRTAVVSADHPGMVTVNGQTFPLPKAGSFHKIIRGKHGMTSIDITTNDSMLVQIEASHISEGIP